MQITESKFGLGMIWLAIASSSVVHIEPALSDILMLASLGLFFVLGMRIPQGVGLPGLLLGIFLVTNVAAAAFTVEPADTLRFMAVRFYMAAACLLFTCLIYQNAARVLPVMWNAYLVAALIAIFFGAAGYFGFIDPGEQLMENDRVRAFFKDPNVYGPFLIPVAMHSVAKLETAEKGEVIKNLAILIVCALGVLLAFSRGAYINFVSSFSLYLVLRLSTQRNPVLRKRVLKMTALILLGGLVVLGGVASTDKVQNMLDTRLKVVQYYDMGEGGRLTRQLAIAKEIAVKPFGIGPGETEKDYYFGQAPHNLYLHTMIESGWIGGFAYLGFILISLWRAGRYIRRAPNISGTYIAVYTSVIGVLIQSVFIDSTHWRHFYMLFAMLWGPLLYWENQLRQIVHSTNKSIVRSQVRTA